LARFFSFLIGHTFGGLSVHGIVCVVGGGARGWWSGSGLVKNSVNND
jgi:hypothetical protein